MAELATAEGRRPSGRPPRISREQILAATLRLLEADGLNAFRLAILAKSVGVSVMALYTYFPSRSVLLDAVAEAVFAEFEPPLAGAGWEATLRAWIAALRRGFERRPMALELIRWDEHIAPAWLNVWRPMVHALSAEGLEGERLLFACRWLSSAAMGALHGHFAAVPRSALTALVGHAGLSEAEDAQLAQLAKLHDPDQRQAVFEFEVENLVRALGELVDAQARARDQTA